MPWQLIYTSAPRGLLSGQSGFCTVARSANLREALVQRLEQISSYHYLRVAEAATANRNPTISAFRLLDLRGAKYYVLTRIQPCGLDFTARTNHLAHHVVFQPDELANLPSPAAILRHWPGWMAAWQEEPRFMEEMDPAGFAAVAKTYLPAQTWARLTGDGGRAAGLLESECVRGCYLVCPPGSEEQVLEMYCETLELLNPEGRFPLRPWRHTFTAFLQGEDNPNDFQWRACQENTPAYKQAVSRSASLIGLQSVRVPANDLVKRAREGPAPPPPAPAPSRPVPRAAPSLRLERSARTPAAPPPLISSVNIKKPGQPAKPMFLDLNFSINWVTLGSLGIFALLLAVGIGLKMHKKPAEQGNPPPAPRQKPPPEASSPVALPPKDSAPLAARDAKVLDCLVGDGPTFVVEVPNLTNFSLPIGSILPFQNLLNRYDKLATLPDDIRLEVNQDHWDFASKVPMRVEGRKGRQFSASLGESVCAFDYSDWLDRKGNALAVQAHFEGATHAFSVHFGFSQPAGGNPFRLLFVQLNNPPEPLHLAASFLQHDGQHMRALMEGSLQRCLSANYTLLEGRQWQMQLLTRPDAQPAQRLYQNWPANQKPHSNELDFAEIGQKLRLEREKYGRQLDGLSEFLGRPLGKWLGSTNTNMASFLAFSQGNLTQPRFAEYLKALKDTAPDGSWIKKWRHVDPDQLDTVSRKFENLYNLWSTNSPLDQPHLTATIKIGESAQETNYFIAVWRRLKERELVLGQWNQVQQRIKELKQAYVALCIVDPGNPRQPRPGLEMIRFEGR